MGFVKDDRPVEVVPQPIDDLVESRAPVTPCRLAQGGVGREQDAPVHADRVGLLPRRLRGNVAIGAADRAPVAARIFQEGIVLRQPHRPRPPLGQVVSDDAGDLPALAAACAVAQEEPLAELDRARMVVLDQDHLMRRIAEDPRSRQDLGMGLTGVDHRLHLGVRH